MTAASRKREPSVASAIAAMAKAGLVPRLERRPDGTVVVTGMPPVPEVDWEAEFVGWKIDHALRERKEHAQQVAIIEAQREMIASLVWMLLWPRPQWRGE